MEESLPSRIFVWLIISSSVQHTWLDSRNRLSKLSLHSSSVLEAVSRAVSRLFPLAAEDELPSWMDLRDSLGVDSPPCKACGQGETCVCGLQRSGAGVVLGIQTGMCEWSDDRFIQRCGLECFRVIPVAYRGEGLGGLKPPSPNFRSFDKVEPDCKLRGKCLVFLFQHPN